MTCISQMIILLIVSIYCNSIVIDESNYIVLKNDKVSVLNLRQLYPTSNNLYNSVWIKNNKDSFTIQVPILSKPINNDIINNKIANYSDHFFQIYEKIQTLGYIKPNQLNSNHFVKGYKYFRAQQNQLIKKQIIMLIENIVERNNFKKSSLRTEDTFTMELILTEQNQFKINHVKIDYLFTTFKAQQLDQNMKKIIKNTYKQSQYLQLQPQGIIQRKLSGRGFHQKVNLTYTLGDKLNIEIDEQKQKCFLEFSDVLPETTYIDSDQRRKQTTNYEVINVELPAFVSKQYFYKYRVSLMEFQQVGVNKYLYQQPIHFRYPKPSELKSTKIDLHPIETAWIICIDGDISNYYALQQNLFFVRGTASIPHGDPSMSKIVSIVTLSVCLIVVIKIFSILKKD